MESNHPDKYTAVDDKFLETLLKFIEERDLYSDLSEEDQEKFNLYKNLKNKDN